MCMMNQQGVVTLKIENWQVDLLSQEGSGQPTFIDNGRLKGSFEYNQANLFENYHTTLRVFIQR